MTEDGKRLRVLVVDDHQVIADTLASILQVSGYEATTAYSGEQAVETAITSNTDVLITDVVMGGISGIEAAVRILRNRPACKIILFSGQAGTANLIEESEAQGYDFEIFNKPVHPTVLLNCLAAWQVNPTWKCKPLRDDDQRRRGVGLRTHPSIPAPALAR